MDSYESGMNTNAAYGADETRRTDDNFDNNSGMRSNPMRSTGMGQNDRFESSNTSGGYGQQDRFENTGSNTMGGGMGGGMNNDSSLGGNRTDDLSSGGAGYGGMNNDEFTNTAGRDEFSAGNRDEFGTGNREHGKASMGDKVKGGAEKLAGKVMGNPGMQERGQERKMGEFEQRNNDF
ncbi:hypothetical protein B0H14DRAFT_2771334 [Mycena olivaceomarginata]|nr:hypothetical protein B0H14DRAFT_2771334 [Mycena olivaceomarginata]